MTLSERGVCEEARRNDWRRQGAQAGNTLLSPDVPQSLCWVYSK